MGPDTPMRARQEAALPFLAWARVWSPLVSTPEREEAWRALGLPQPFERFDAQLWGVFHAGVPAPAVPLLLHSALGREGGHVREEWMRVIRLLDLEWGDETLPPDHLAVACEVFAAAVENGDETLTRELAERYLVPWCRAADSRLAADRSALAVLPSAFAAAIAAVAPGA